MFIVAAREDQGGLSHFSWPEPESHPHMSVRSIVEEAPDAADIRTLGERELDALTIWQKFLDCLHPDAPLPSFPIWATEYNATYPFEKQVPEMLSATELGAFNGIFGQNLVGLSIHEQEKYIPTYARGEKLFPKWKQQFIRDNRAFFQKYENELKDITLTFRTNLVEPGFISFSYR